MPTIVQAIIVMAIIDLVFLSIWGISWIIESFAEYREYVHACEVQYHIRPMLLLPWLRAGKVWA